MGVAGAARFLGYEITVQHNDRKTTGGKRSINGTIALRVPMDVIRAKSVPYLKHGKPEWCPKLINLDDLAIIGNYGAKYRGLVQYYLLAGDVWRLNRLHWVMQTCMLKTLAAKHRSTVSKMAAIHKTTIDTPHGPHTCFQARMKRAGRKPLVTQFGGIPLQRQRTAVLHDRQPAPVPARRKELTSRLRAGRCEWCQKQATVEVHQVRKLANLTKPGKPQPAWAAHMAKRQRKTLVVCTTCHDTIHARQPTTTVTQ